MIFKRKLGLHTPAYSKNKENERDDFTFMNKNGCKENQVVFVGDSITEMLSTADWYGDYSVKSGLCVYNRGIGGDTSDRLLERFENNVLNINPKCIVLLIGTNDQGIMAPETTVDYIDKIIALTKKSCPEAGIILQGVYPVNTKDFPKNQKRRTNEIVYQINCGLSAVAEKYGIKYIDLTSLLADAQGNLNKDYSHDGLHLNAKGYKITTQEIVKLLPQS